MNDAPADTPAIPTAKIHVGPGPRLMGAGTLIGNPVFTPEYENLGEIKEIMLDVHAGRIRYAVLTFGSFLGMGGKLFAIPWEALELDTRFERFVLQVDKDRLKSAPGFDPDDWPTMADPQWSRVIHDYYGVPSYLDKLHL